MLPNMKCAIVLVLILFNHQEVSSNPLLIGLEVADIVISTIDRIISLINPDQTSQVILNSITEISMKLDQIGINLNQKVDDLASSIPQKIHDIIRIENDVKDMESNMRDINNLYKLIFVNLGNDTFSNFTLQSFIIVATSIGDNSLINKVENIHSLFLPGELGIIKINWLSIFMKTRENCDELYASHQWLYELFSLIGRVEMRVLVMVTTAYKMRSVSTHENHDDDINRIKNRFLDKMNSYSILMRESIANASTEIYRCEAPSLINGQTYIELEKLVQKIILNTDQLSSAEGCETCESITEFHGSLINYKQYHSYPIESDCNGRIIDCKTWSNSEFSIFQQNYIQVCVMPKWSSRRYQWLKNSEDRSYGNTDVCYGNLIHEIPSHKRRAAPSAFSFISVSAGFLRDYYCNYCLCTCIEDDDSSTSVRKFNSEPQISHYKDNMVVIGVRFIKDNDGIINIQIKEGKLMPEGKILPGSESWAPIEKSEDSESLLKMGYHRSFMNLEAIQVPSHFNSSLIIGVGFKEYSRQMGASLETAIGIEVLTAEFNFTSGKVNEAKEWFYSEYQNSRTGPSRADLNLDGVDNPLNSRVNLPDNANEPQWIQFQPTDDDLDAGQTVVPFLDIQPVYTDPGFPLRGIGLFHKGASGYGGYVALKILTLDLSKFI